MCVGPEISQDPGTQVAMVPRLDGRNAYHLCMRLRVRTGRSLRGHSCMRARATSENVPERPKLLRHSCGSKSSKSFQRARICILRSGIPVMPQTGSFSAIADLAEFSFMIGDGKRQLAPTTY